MFTIQQIEEAHAQVKSGADFPKYIQDIKNLGVRCFETWVRDSHTVYYGENDFKIESPSQYSPLQISTITESHQFKTYLTRHQQGKTDYYTFCIHCAETGIEKWILDLTLMTCVYYDCSGTLILSEVIPSI